VTAAVVHLRRATPADADAVVPLIHCSGPAAFDYVFAVPGRASAQDYLRRAFVHGDGEFGYRNHTVVEVNDVVAAVGAAWGNDANLRFALAAAGQILGCYGVSHGAAVIARGLRVESVIQPPRRGAWYVAHLGVHPDARSRGFGQALVLHLLEEGRRRGCRTAELDVASVNPRAESLYERLGFRVHRERKSALANAQGAVPDHRRMVLDLQSPHDAR
jgi:ribosomal protein S18 acetylase RimI-like enzyme